MACFRKAYFVFLPTIMVLLFLIAACSVEYFRARHLYSRSPSDCLGYYQNILKRDPGNVNAIKMLASLYFNLKRFDESKKYYRKAVETDPSDPEPYYSIAVIDWNEAYQSRSDAKAKLGLPADRALKDRRTCEDLKAKNSAVIREGMEMLLRVLELYPGYKNTSSYMGMLWHEKAYIDCGDAAAIRLDLKRAEQWMNKRKNFPKYDDSKSAKLYTAWFELSCTSKLLYNWQPAKNMAARSV